MEQRCELSGGLRLLLVGAEIGCECEIYWEIFQRAFVLFSGRIIEGVQQVELSGNLDSHVCAELLCTQHSKNVIE